MSEVRRVGRAVRLDALAAADEAVLPEGLARLLELVVAGEAPRAPVAIG